MEMGCRWISPTEKHSWSLQERSAGEKLQERVGCHGSAEAGGQQLVLQEGSS